MLDSHTRQINTTTIKRAWKDNEKKKNNQEETKLRCRLGTASNEITWGGGRGVLQIIIGSRPSNPVSKPHFYILKWVSRRIHYFSYFCSKEIKDIKIFHLKIFIFTVMTVHVRKNVKSSSVGTTCHCCLISPVVSCNSNFPEFLLLPDVWQ